MRRRTLLQGVGAGTISPILYGDRVAGQSASTEEWRFGTDGQIWGGPTIVEGKVYVGSTDGHLYAIDADTGDLQWRFDTGGAVVSSPTVVGGTAYVGSNDGHLYAVDAVTGDQQWRFETEAEIRSSPTVVGGTVYVGSDDSNLYGITTASGEEAWRFETGDQVFSSPTVVDGTVYVGSNDDHLYAVDATSGDQKWRFETNNPFQSSPTVVGGTVYVGSGESGLYAIDATTGDEQWELEVEGGFFSSPTVIDGTVYVGSFEDNLYAVDATNGEPEWRFDTGEGIGSSPTVAGGTVYVGNGDGFLYAVDASSGDQQWQLETEGGVTSSPTVVDGTVYVGSTGGGLYAVATGGTSASEGSRVTLGTLGHHHVWADRAGGGEETTSSAAIDLEIRNNFIDAQPRGFLERLFAGFDDAVVPPGAGPGPNKDEAYIDVDITATLSSLGDRRARSLTLTFETQGTEFGTTELSRVSAHEFEVSSLSIAAPIQAGEGITIIDIQRVIEFASLFASGPGPDGVPFSDAIQAKTEAYPDVFVTQATVTYEDGSEATFDLDRKLPRYIDICPNSGLVTANPLQYPEPECNLEDYTQADLQDAKGVAVLSPASVALVDGNGNRTGRVPTDDGFEIVDEIPGAFYSGALDHEFVLAPGDGDYGTLITGTGEGTATVVQSQATTDGSVPRLERAWFQDITVTDRTVLSGALEQRSLQLNAEGGSRTVQADLAETVDFEAVVGNGERPTPAAEPVTQEATPTDRERETGTPESASAGDGQGASAGSSTDDGLDSDGSSTTSIDGPGDGGTDTGASPLSGQNGLIAAGATGVVGTLAAVGGWLKLRDDDS